MTQSVFTADALVGEIVLVTGASRGIGAAILDVCVKAGATVIGTATVTPALQRFPLVSRNSAAKAKAAF